MGRNWQTCIEFLSPQSVPNKHSKILIKILILLKTLYYFLWWTLFINDIDIPWMVYRWAYTSARCWHGKRADNHEHTTGYRTHLCCYIGLVYTLSNAFPPVLWFILSVYSYITRPASYCMSYLINGLSHTVYPRSCVCSDL